MILGLSTLLASKYSLKKKISGYLKDPRQPVLAVNYALIYAGLGEKEKSFKWLERSFRNKENSLSGIYDMCFDVLSDDPRWGQIKRRIKTEWLKQ